MKYATLLFFLAVVALIAYSSSQVTMPAVASWYQEIFRPHWTPPDWVFAPVWTALYILIALSGWLAWNALLVEGAAAKLTHPAMLLYWLQLGLNAAWSWVFFGMASLLGGAVIIVLLLVAIMGTIFLFRRFSEKAAWLLMPYLLWVIYAASLNIGIVILNS